MCVTLSLAGDSNTTLLWRHNGRDCVSNHQPNVCLFNRSSRRRSKKISKLRVTGLCAGNSPETGEFPVQMAIKAENVSIWWRHHDTPFCPCTANNAFNMEWYFYWHRINTMAIFHVACRSVYITNFVSRAQYLMKAYWVVRLVGLDCGLVRARDNRYLDFEIDVRGMK